MSLLPAVPRSTQDYLQALQEAYRQGIQFQQEQQPVRLPQSPQDFAQALQAAFCHGAASSSPSSNNTPSSVSPPAVVTPTKVSWTNDGGAASNNTTGTKIPLAPHPTVRAQQVQQTEVSKRQLRLARNRASARHRRMRHKVLVEQYEHQVRDLQDQLQRLAAVDHESDEATSALVNVLAMERGRDESVVVSEQVAVLLQQQTDHVEQLQDVAAEQSVLLTIAGADKDELYQDLARELALTPAQCRALLLEQPSESDSMRLELQGLATVRECGRDLLSHPEWLYESTAALAEPLQADHMVQQWAKYTIWTDAAPLQDLDVVSAAAAQQDLPVFVFGTEPQRLARTGV